MRALPFEDLLNWILREFEERQSIFGIHRSLFYLPKKDGPYSVPDVFGHFLSTPIGPAAGPHTQLAQNIVSAWLCGGRFIELKTVQVRDDLQIPRPCIDMEDEGYNVEWSQELRLDESALEYVKAWALVHLLHRLLGFEGKVPQGTIFNMSVGYDLAGIRSGPMTRFLDRMADASGDLAGIRAVLETKFPQFGDVRIPPRVADSVTLSTMHGCPPEEIAGIAAYLLENRGLHTTVKLNPTLLGKDEIYDILHGELGFCDVRVPDEVFDRDLQYDSAVELVRSLQRTAARCGLTCGVKLGNTLAVSNHKGSLPGAEMYMSGRALYPLTISLFEKLARDFHGDLNVSFSGGADALNVSGILASGALPVTCASDLLKPGGYGRLRQYLENLEGEMRKRGAASLAEFSRDKLGNLERAAAGARRDPRFKKSYSSGRLPKVESGLNLFDCITAPCVERCPVIQDIPGYARLIARGEYDRALETILARNPLPGATGHVCPQFCRDCCTRAAGNYDEPVSIRALKRFAAEKGRVTLPVRGACGRRVAVIGAGPSGLAAAAFLAQQGVSVTVFETENLAGGMMRLAPAFRLPYDVIRQDVERIAGLGVEFRLSLPLTEPPERLLQRGFDAVYVASGFQKDAHLSLEGADGCGVIAALEFLEQVRRGVPVELGPKVLVIGGGDTALDAARVARRLTGEPVTIVYRRTRHEMPARAEELAGALEEGVVLAQLVSPVRVVRRAGRVTALECVRNRLGEPETDGRRRPIPVAGSRFEIEADAVIIAVGQRPDAAFLEGSAVSVNRDGSIAIHPESGFSGVGHVFAGGDAVRGPASIVEACADGRRAAEAICAELGIEFRHTEPEPPEPTESEILQVKRTRARREPSRQARMIPPDRRSGFDLIERTLDEEAARSEAQRCLQCATLCDKCVEVCPNRANQVYRIPPESFTVPVLTCRGGVLTVVRETVFEVRQARQILHLPDLCNECGNCATFCVHAGKPHADKPRLYFGLAGFARDRGKRYRLQTGEAGWTLQGRGPDGESSLVMHNTSGELFFENGLLRGSIARAGFRFGTMALKKQFHGELPLVEPAEMYVMAAGAVSSLAHLPWQQESGGADGESNFGIS